MIVSKANPLFRAGLKRAPGHPIGDRILVRPLPVMKQSEGGLLIPDNAKERQFAGILIAAGDKAADVLWDYGIDQGDEVWYAKYAGVIEEWQHIVKEGTDPSCPHDGSWDIVPSGDKRWDVIKAPDVDMQLRSCRTCGVLKLSERVNVMSVDDILMDIDLQARLEAGTYKRTRAATEDGKTRYLIERNEGAKDQWEY